jgi:hypothetical protein
MRLALLILAAAALPFVWGWAVHWLIGRVWPERGRDSDPAPRPVTPASSDFQI